MTVLLMKTKQWQSVANYVIDAQASIDKNWWVFNEDGLD